MKHLGAVAWMIAGGLLAAQLVAVRADNGAADATRTTGAAHAVRSPPHSAHVTPVNIQVSHAHYRAYGEPYLAINPRDPRNLLGAAQCINDLPVPCTFASFDGGVTWRENGALPLPAGDKVGGDVSVAFDARGTGFVASHAGGGWDVDTVLVWRTGDGGRSFARPVVVFPGSGGRIVVDHPWLAVDTTNGPYAGNVYVAWTANYAGGFTSHTRLLFSRSVDGGRSFTKPRTLVTVPHGFPGIPVITMGRGGTVHVVYAVGHRNPYTPPFVPLARMVVSSPDGGRSFGPPHAIAAEPAFLTLPGLNMANIQAVAADPADGTLYVALTAYRRGTHHTDILFWRSRDDGRTWAGPVRVNDDPLGEQIDHFQPQLVVTPQGRIDVSYFTLAHGHVDLYLSQSITHGSDFEPGRRISGVSFDPALSSEHRDGSPWIGDYQGLAAGPGVSYPFWNDTRTGRMEIFTAAVRVATAR